MTKREKTVVAVVLAAGQASRMGRPKQLLPWGETTILGQTLQNVQHAQVDEVLAVSGAYRAEVEKEAARFGVSLLFNPNFAEGEMISSLQMAVKLLLGRPAPPDGVLVMLADLPFIPTTIINQVIRSFQARPEILVAPIFNGRRGHPVIIGRSLFEEVLALPPAAAPRDLFRKYPDNICQLPVDSDVILKDIDTPEQYERMIRLFD